MADHLQNLDALIGKLKWEDTDRRQTVRLKRAMRLRIVWNDKTEAVSGMLVDLSQSGARIRLMHDKEIPEDFGLELEAGLVVPCKVVHRDGGNVGAKFVIPS